MANTNLTGVIKNASRIITTMGDVVIFGEVYNDKNGRFPDGTPIYTSKVVEEDGNVVYTKNSIYEVEYKENRA